MASFNFYNIFRVISAENLSKIIFREELLLLPSFSCIILELSPLKVFAIAQRLSQQK